jgi:hypothetical protein
MASTVILFNFPESVTKYWPSIGQNLIFENVKVENLSERNLQNSGISLHSFLSIKLAQIMVIIEYKN